jgi:dimethylamine/trimethylamine dehydrogenase
VARRVLKPVPIAAGADVLTPDEIMAGRMPRNRSVMVYDDDHYYLGGVLAEHLVRAGFSVKLVTPSAMASAWTFMTMEQAFIQARLIELGIGIECNRVLRSIAADGAEFGCAYTGRPHRIEADSIVLVTARIPETSLHDALQNRAAEWPDTGLESVRLIGDDLAPATIAHAVYEGRRYAEQLGETIDPDRVPFKREVAGLAHGWSGSSPTIEN